MDGSNNHWEASLPLQNLGQVVPLDHLWQESVTSHRSTNTFQHYQNIHNSFQTHKKHVITISHQEINFYKPNKVVGWRKWMQSTSNFKSLIQVDSYPLFYLLERLNNNKKKNDRRLSLMPFLPPFITRIYCDTDWSRKGTD